MSSRASFETASVIALFLSIILGAIAFFPGTALPLFATKTFIIGGGVLLTLALYILARLTRGNLVLPPTLPLLVLILPLVAYVLSAIFTGGSIARSVFGPSLSTDSVGFVLAMTLFGLLAALALRRSEQYRAFFLWLGVALAIVIVAGIAALLLGQVTSSISPTFTLLGNFEDLAIVAGLGLTLSLVALRELAIASRTRILLLILSACELVILAIANSGVLWVLVALAALALFVEAVMKRRPADAAEADVAGTEVFTESEPMEPAGPRSLAAPLVVLAIALFFLLGSLGNGLATSLHASYLDVRPSWQSTLMTGSDVYKTSPIFGTGPGGFGSAWLASRNTALNSTPFWNIDFTSGVGYIPTAVITTGIIGALAWAILLITFLIYGLRALLLRSPADPYVRFALLASFVGFAYLATLSIALVPGATVLALLFVFAGLFVSTLRYTRGAREWGIVFAKSPRTGFAIVFAFTLLLLGSVGSAYTLIGHYLGAVNLAEAQNALAAGNVNEANARAAAALSFAPSGEAYQAEAVVANQLMNQIANNTSLTPADAQKQFQNVLSGGIAAAQAATKLEPNNYQNWVALGNLYAAVVPLNISGAYDNAKQAYTKADALNPTSPAIPYLMAQLEIADKNAKDAETDLVKAINLKQDYTQAIFLLSQLEVSTGNVQNALAAAEAAAYFAPTDPNVLFQLGILRAVTGNLNGAAQALQGAVKANSQFSNARYYLAALYAKGNDYTDAIVQLQAIAAFSDANKTAVDPLIAQLQAKKNPFPPNLLSASTTALK